MMKLWMEKIHITTHYMEGLPAVFHTHMEHVWKKYLNSHTSPHLQISLLVFYCGFGMIFFWQKVQSIGALLAAAHQRSESMLCLADCSYRQITPLRGKSADFFFFFSFLSKSTQTSTHRHMLWWCSCLHPHTQFALECGIAWFNVICVFFGSAAFTSLMFGATAQSLCNLISPRQDELSLSCISFLLTRRAIAHSFRPMPL